MLTDPGQRMLRVRSAARALTTDQQRMATLLVVMVPVIVVVIMGWQHRWTSDDGFINFRYVDQIRHGNGPVFNAGERVEAFTSPLWLGLLLFLDLILPLRLEWIAVLSGLVLTAAGIVFAAAGASRLWRHVVGDGPTFPAGLLVFAALPPVWDFATSGLDNALGVAWLGASWWALCRRVFPQGTRPAGQITPWGTCLLIGLGPLVRPELGLMTAAFLGVLLFAEASWRGRVRVVAWALALPLAYEIFRMAYYAAIVPNSALAKEAGASQWGRGWSYLVDFAEPYYLWIPLALLLPLAFIPLLRSALTRATRLDALLIAAPLVAGLAQAAYVVRVGGDFMHARMLLPALFCVLLPVSVVVVRGWRWVAALLLVPWVLLTAIAIRYSGAEPRFVGQRIRVSGVVNERDFYVGLSGGRNPVTIDDFYGASDSLSWARDGRNTRIRAERGERGLLLDPTNPMERPLRLDARGVDTPIVAVVVTLGLFGYAAGPDVFVVDSLGLATAIGSHFRPPPLSPGEPGFDRPGHEKPHRTVWEIARFTPSEPVEPRELRDARRSLRCGSVPDLLDAVTARFGPGRAWRNIWESFNLTTFRFPEDPEKAVKELCG